MFGAIPEGDASVAFDSQFGLGEKIERGSSKDLWLGRFRVESYVWGLENYLA
jgi:hypothetical protein